MLMDVKQLRRWLDQSEKKYNLFVLNEKLTRQVIWVGTFAGGFFYPFWSIIYQYILGEEIYDPIGWRVLFSLPLLIAFLLNFNKRIQPTVQTYLVAFAALMVQGHLLFLTIVNDFRLEYQMGMMTIIGVCAQFFMSFSVLTLYILSALIGIITCAILRQDLADAIFFAGSITVITMGSISLFFRISITRALAESKEDVERKNQETQAILEGIQSGILGITEENGRLLVNSSLSQSFYDIMGIEDQQIGSGSTMDEIFLDKINLTEEQKSMISDTLLTSIGEDDIAWSLNHHLLPDTVTMGDEGNKYLGIQWNPVFDHSDNIVQILLVIRDETHKILSDREQQDQREKVERILRFTKLSEAKFTRFQNYLHQTTLDLKHSDLKQNKHAILRILHTMKGNSRANGFDDFSTMIHLLESSILQSEDNFSQDEFMTELEGVMKLLDKYKTDWEDIYGSKSESRGSISIDESKMIKIRDLVSTKERNHGLDDASQIINILDEALYGNITEQLNENLLPLDEVANKLHKNIPALKIVPNTMAIRPEYLQELNDIFVHMFRNSLDHGIETVDERKDKGKSERGQIHMTVDRTTHNLTMQYWDDGRGLNVQKILNLDEDLPDKVAQSHKEIEDKIFAQGVSTSESINEISGRGIGMDAVRSFIRDLGGEISLSIKSPIGQGFYDFCFNITLPRTIFHEYGADQHNKKIDQAG